MTKLRCLRDHSSMVWGSPVYGEEFEVADGYVDQLVSAGLAERVDKPPTTGEPSVADPVDSVVTSERVITGRGRRK